MTSKWQQLYSQNSTTPSHFEEDESIEEELKNIQDDIHSRLNSGVHANEDIAYHLEHYSVGSLPLLAQQEPYYSSYEGKSSSLVVDTNKSDLYLVDSEEELQADLLLKELDNIIQEEQNPETILTDLGIDQILLHGGYQVTSHHLLLENAWCSN